MSETTDTIKFLDEELMELRRIMNDNYAQGAFCGMITNIYFNQFNGIKEGSRIFSIDSILKQALAVRMHLLKKANLKNDPKNQPDPRLTANPQPNVEIQLD